MAIVSCPKCGGSMETGFTGGYAFSHWVEGLPERSTWVGLKLKGRRKMPISTSRCSRCGFLESYAVGAEG